MCKLYVSCTLWQQRIKYNIIIYECECMSIRDIILYPVKDKAATYISYRYHQSVSLLIKGIVFECPRDVCK